MKNMKNMKNFMINCNANNLYEDVYVYIGLATCCSSLIKKHYTFVHTHNGSVANWASIHDNNQILS